MEGSTKILSFTFYPTRINVFHSSIVEIAPCTSRPLEDFDTGVNGGQMMNKV